jgi:hypothetical protein
MPRRGATKINTGREATMSIEKEYALPQLQGNTLSELWLTCWRFVDTDVYIRSNHSIHLRLSNPRRYFQRCLLPIPSCVLTGPSSFNENRMVTMQLPLLSKHKSSTGTYPSDAEMFPTPRDLGVWDLPV